MLDWAFCLHNAQVAFSCVSHGNIRAEETLIVPNKVTNLSRKSDTSNPMDFINQYLCHRILMALFEEIIA